MATPEANVNVRKEGCFSGCGTTFAVLVIIAMLIEYWYVTVPVALVGLGITWWVWRYRQREAAATPTEAPEAPATPQEPEITDIGRWEPDPRDPERLERWREGDRWTGATRPQTPREGGQT